jgi:hypothetical protein
MGKIKEGKGTIIGNAGEYLVVGELLKRGVVAAPAPRNTPGFYVMATNGIKSLNIRVKTKTEAATSWVWICKKDAQRTIFRNISDKSDFTVLVDLGEQRTPPRYYIVPTAELDKRLNEEYKQWVEQPPKRGKPHDPNNRMRRIGLTFPHHKEWLSNAKDAWSLILGDLG